MMGFGSVGEGSGENCSSSISNLSALAPLFTVDRLNWNPILSSIPVLNYSELSYAVEPYSHTSQFASPSAPIKRVPRKRCYELVLGSFDVGKLRSASYILWIVMVGFKNRYMLVEVFLDPNKDLLLDEPIIITQFNLSKAIKDSIQANFGECGLALSQNSFQVKYVNPITKVCIFRTSREEYQKVWAATAMVKSIGNCPVVFNLLDLSGSIRACKDIALKCDELKFEQYKLSAGDRLTADVHQHMQNCLEKIRILEH